MIKALKLKHDFLLKCLFKSNSDLVYYSAILGKYNK